jgi:tRNA G26 N,N-dimethylase Trm1
MIEIYKTNVKTRRQASQIIGLLQNSFSKISINFDLQDCDKVLRVEGIKPADTTKVISDLIRLGFTCEILN